MRYGAGLLPTRSEARYRVETLGHRGWVVLGYDDDWDFIETMITELDSLNETFRVIERDEHLGEVVLHEKFAEEPDEPVMAGDSVDWCREGF